MTSLVNDHAWGTTAARLAGLPARLVRRLVSRGLLDTVGRAGFLTYESYREWRLGIDTGGFIHRHQLTSNPASVDYDPIGYRTLDRALRQVKLIPGQDVFLDYGCGKGRPLITAAMRSFAKVIGVEISQPLCQIARENVRRAGARLRCSEIEIVQVAAEQYSIPDTVSAIFMFNPFTGSLLDAVVRNISQSLQRRPRQLTILYVLPVQASDRFRQCDWLRQKHDQATQGLRLVVYESLGKSESE